MATTFDISKYYRAGDGLETYSPFWIIAVVRFENPLTYSRKNRKSAMLGMPERKPIIIAHECLQVSVSSTKGSHISSLNATLNPGDREYLSEIMPGDWVFAWMLRDHHEGKRVLDLIKKFQAANGYYDGLKFVGRVQSMRKRVQVSPHTGEKNITFTLSGSGFSELDYSVFYEPNLLKQQIVPAQFDELGLFLLSVVVDENEAVMDKGLIDINKILPTLTRLFLGRGAYARSFSLDLPNGDNIKAAPAGAPLVPTTAAQWLGAPAATTYSDLLEMMTGIQAFEDIGDVTQSESPWAAFLPSPLMEDPLFKDESPSTKVYKTGNPLRGQFSAYIPPIMNQPFWSVLGNFLNHPINEMYMALRPNPEGKVMPTLTVRQIPFSSRFGLPEPVQTNAPNYVNPVENPDEKGWLPEFNYSPSETLQKNDTTKFLDLPRWKVSKVWSADVGRSDALRTNYVHISGIPGVGTGVDEVNMFIRCPPMRDDEDIGRSGLRPYQATVNCTFKDTVVGPSRWRDLMTDVLMGQHLTLTGTLVVPGIDLPICPGDNLEYEGVVYHIEAISHAAGIAGDNSKYFQTILQLSNGVAAQPNSLEGDVSQYSGVVDGDAVTVRAVTTVETDDE